MKLLILIAFMAITCKSFAQFNSSQMFSSDGKTDWKFYDISMRKDGGSSFFYDSAYTIKDSYGYLKTWEREERLYTTTGGKKDTKSCAIETLYVINCSNKTVMTIEVVTRNIVDNSIIKEYVTSSYNQYWANVAPGTIIEEFVNKVCGSYNLKTKP